MAASPPLHISGRCGDQQPCEQPAHNLLRAIGPWRNRLFDPSFGAARCKQAATHHVSIAGILAGHLFSRSSLSSAASRGVALSGNLCTMTLAQTFRRNTERPRSRIPPICPYTEFRSCWFDVGSPKTLVIGLSCGII